MLAIVFSNFAIVSSCAYKNSVSGTACMLTPSPVDSPFEPIGSCMAKSPAGCAGWAVNCSNAGRLINTFPRYNPDDVYAVVLSKLSKIQYYLSKCSRSVHIGKETEQKAQSLMETVTPFKRCGNSKNRRAVVCSMSSTRRENTPLREAI